MESRQLQDIERITLALAAAAIALAFVLLPRQAAFSVAIGAALTSLNAIFVRWLARRASKAAKGTRAGLLLFNVKMLALIGLVYLAVRVLHVSPIWLVVGLTLFPLAILIAGLKTALSSSTNSDDTPSDASGDLNG